MGAFKEELAGAVAVREEKELRKEAASKEDLAVYRKDWTKG